MLATAASILKVTAASGGSSGPTRWGRPRGRVRKPGDRSEQRHSIHGHGGRDSRHRFRCQQSGGFHANDRRRCRYPDRRPSSFRTLQRRQEQFHRCIGSGRASCCSLRTSCHGAGRKMTRPSSWGCSTPQDRQPRMLGGRRQQPIRRTGLAEPAAAQVCGWPDLHDRWYGCKNVWPATLR